MTPDLAAAAAFWALVGSGLVGTVRDSVSLLLLCRNHSCRGDSIPAAIISVAMLMWAEETDLAGEPVEEVSDRLKTIAASVRRPKSNERAGPW